MNLETFKDHYMLRPEQVIIIDRAFVLDEDEMHLLALTYKENAYTLWVMASLSEEIEESEMIIDPLKHTNRESIKGRMPDTRAIESLEIGEHVFEFNGSTTNSFYFQGNQSLHKLQYFIEQGIELSYWNDVPLNKMQLIEYTYSKSVPMININLKDKIIKLKFRPYHKEAEVFYKYSLNFNLKKSVEFKYYNPFEEKEESFYVTGFEIYDVESFKRSIKDHPKYEDIPKEHMNRMTEMMIKYFEKLKGRNSSLVLMTYEAARGLSFHSTAYLDRKIEESSDSSSGAISFVFKEDDKIGEHGKRLFVTSLQDIPNDGLDTIEFELHTVSKKYHEKVSMMSENG